MIIFLDMDNVLTDFNGLMMEHFGVPFDRVGGGNAVERWKLISSELPYAYARLKPLPDADDLVAYVTEVCVTYDAIPGILTAVPKYGRLPLAQKHKYEWLRQRWPHLCKNFNIGPFAEDKQKHARPGHVLIDDSKLNIPQWNAAGGYGILHTSAESSIQQLKQYVEEKHASLSR